MYKCIKTYFLNQCNGIKLTNSEKKMKIMIVNSKIKHKPKAILGVIEIYNQFHNFLRLSDVLPNSRFTASETMGDYYL